MRLTPTLNEAVNDTGRTAYCGPMVISAITGYSVSKVEQAIRAGRDSEAAAHRLIVGTTAEDVAAALAIFGYEMERQAGYEHLERKERPTVWTWMQRPRSAFSYYVLAVSVGKDGHWICIKGAKIIDTYTEGKWIFAADGPHRGARMMGVYRVKKSLDGMIVPA